MRLEKSTTSESEIRRGYEVMTQVLQISGRHWLGRLLLPNALPRRAKIPIAPCYWPETTHAARLLSQHVILQAGSAARSSPFAGKRSWKNALAPYHRSVAWKGLWQLLNTLLPYAALWYLMYRSLAVSVWLTLPLALVAGGFLVRIFIIFHDCTHGSFFNSSRANEVVGCVMGILCFTPYHRWRREHSAHHASAGDLDRRGTGDVWTMTVQEYLEASRWKRCAYRLARNPFILFVIAPLVLFVVLERFPASKDGRRERLSVHGTNLALVLMVAGLSSVFGWEAYLLLQLAAVTVAGSAGVWLFYVQHQFEGVYWERGKDWDYEKAALEGSSYYKLPRILQWFSGNIGFHHIHHLSPRIPNYHLENCQRSEPLFHSVKPVTLFASLKSFNFRLWDERRRKMVGYPSPDRPPAPAEIKFN